MYPPNLSQISLLAYYFEFSTFSALLSEVSEQTALAKKKKNNRKTKPVTMRLLNFVESYNVI